jgi:hypothetical protein
MSTKIAKKGGKLMYNPIRVIQYRNKMNKPNKINDINDMVKSILIKIYNAMKNIIHNDRNDDKEDLKIYYAWFHNKFYMNLKIKKDSTITPISDNDLLQYSYMMGGNIKEYFTINKYIIKLNNVYQKNSTNIKNIESDVDNIIENIKDITLIYKLCEYYIIKVLSILNREPSIFTVKNNTIIINLGFSPKKFIIILDRLLLKFINVKIPTIIKHPSNYNLINDISIIHKKPIGYNIQNKRPTGIFYGGKKEKLKKNF